jgi:N-acetylmuramic acid 6-phosphate etherase
MKAVTEEANPRTKDIDRRSTIEIVTLISQEDKLVADAVAGVLDRVAQATDLIVERLRSGGRLIYVGTGTSGRLGVLDASEIPPTFGVPQELVVGIIAGGFDALRRAVEAAEDDPEQAARDLHSHKVASSDVVVGISASGNTPYTLGAVQHATKIGAATVAITCNPVSQMAAIVDVSIAPVVGPEVIAGSSRMKAGTAQKMILNMLSTATMIKLGWVYSNLMSNLRATNDKLLRRACAILSEETGITGEEATLIFQAAEWDLRIALLMAQSNLSRDDAEGLLDSHGGSVRNALDAAGNAGDGPG